jgi:hypothetical protein
MNKVQHVEKRRWNRNRAIDARLSLLRTCDNSCRPSGRYESAVSPSASEMRLASRMGERDAERSHLTQFSVVRSL